MGELARLRYLFLYDNQLSGGIPGELGKLTNLRQLLLDGNGLTGEIPAKLSGMSNLEHFLPGTTSYRGKSRKPGQPLQPCRP